MVPIDGALFYAGVLVSISNSTNAATVTFTQNGYWFFFGFAILPILYCISASLFFTPKRIVSPLNMQIFAWLMLSIIEFSHDYNQLFSSFNMPSSSMVNTMVSQWFGVSFVSLFIFVFVGGGQLLVVRLVVGPNLIGVWRKTFTITTDCEHAGKVLDEIDDYRKEEVNGHVVYKMPLGFIDKVLLVLGPDPRDNKHSILATVAYHSGIYSYEQSDESANEREKTIFEIEGRLKHTDPPATIEELKEELYDSTSILAYDLAIKPTRTPFKRTEKLISQIPYFYKAFMAVTFILIVTVQVAYFTHYLPHIDANTWLSTTVLLAFAFFAEAAIPLRDEIQEQIRKQTKKENI